jgi:hypothetical protein
MWAAKKSKIVTYSQFKMLMAVALEVMDRGGDWDNTEKNDGKMAAGQPTDRIEPESRALNAAR